MTAEQEKVLKIAVTAFLAARKLGLDEFHIIEEIFDASNELTASELKSGGQHQSQNSGGIHSR